ncbi:protein of unknown function DUF1304 [Exiguobacterium sp. AT1b]|uniref:Integral membrane protein n=1 Tax=Exiguobacterium sp. (strain ATCC BAA-1283 / AT1b) TaxID=360911 RepID=C4L4F5_EXISA|nr:DUF1304 domain-containing protein [Exiguobacterium sp. AT1b]ACQ71518.1 protein of unknown function DUF1304 [Exiguobacterium sp. AT1b]
MSTLTLVLGTLVAIEFFYIFYLETIATASSSTSRVFRMSKDELTRDSVSVLFKNQGVYNGLIGVGLLYGLYVSPNPVEIVTMMLTYIILVALYGSITSDKKIILTQGGLAILTLLLNPFFKSNNHKLKRG